MTWTLSGSMGSSTHNDDHCHRQNKAVKEEDCSWSLYSGMPDILPGWSVGRLLGRRYTTGRCLWDGAKVKEFILWGPVARDCGIGGGWADWGQHQGGVHPGDECCPRLHIYQITLVSDALEGAEATRKANARFTSAAGSNNYWEAVNDIRRESLIFFLSETKV